MQNLRCLYFLLHKFRGQKDQHNLQNRYEPSCVPLRTLRCFELLSLRRWCQHHHNLQIAGAWTFLNPYTNFQNSGSNPAAWTFHKKHKIVTLKLLPGFTSASRYVYFMYEALIILPSLIGFLDGRNYGKHKTRQTSKQEAHRHLHRPNHGLNPRPGQYLKHAHFTISSG